MADNAQIRKIDTLRTSLQLLDQYSAQLTPEIRAIQENQRQLLERIESLRHDQALRFEPGTHRRVRADALRTEMLKLVGSVRRHFETAPEVRSALRVPHKRASIDTVVRSAESMCDALDSHAEFLRSENVDLRRLDRIRQRAHEIIALTHRLETATPKRQLATSELPGLLKRAMANKDSISRLVVELPDFPIQRWHHAARVPKRSGRPKRRRRRDESSKTSNASMPARDFQSGNKRA